MRRSLQYICRFLGALTFAPWRALREKKCHAEAQRSQRVIDLSALILAPSRALRAVIFLASLACTLNTQAQVFPVQGSAVLIPPYSVHLSDYASASSDRFVLNIVLANVTRPELPVRLRVKIEGRGIKLQTKPEFIGSQIIMQGGVPLRLTGSDLAEYFNPDNLNFSGISRREFDKTGALPQGFYQFCIEVLEYNRGVKISNTICAPGWLILNDPPIVNLPRNNEKLRATLPQNLIFQWTPRHTGSPNSAFMTEYELTMVEVWPENRNPNDAILTSPPILQATTRSTSFIYGPAETPLEPGRRYAFRVRAKSIVGVEDFDLFKNNGYSEVYTFVYGDVCEVPLNIKAQALGAAKFRASWDARFNHTAFQIRFRESNNSSAEWFTTSSMLNDVEVSSLKSNTLYEYQVAAGCGPFESPYTRVATIRTDSPPVAEYSCGLPIETFNLDPAALVASLNVGDVIQAGDFQVALTRVSGGNGTFSGTGTVVVPFLNNVKVKARFTDILVNNENRMVKGYMNVTGAALDIVPDEITAMMDELDETLDKIEDGLNKAEDIANDIDAVLDQAQMLIDEIAAYLPDDILQEINAAKAEMSEARSEMRAAVTPEAKEAAKVEVKQAREKLKDAGGKALKYYAQAVKDILRYLKNSLTKLSQQSKDSTSVTEENVRNVRALLEERYEALKRENLTGLTGTETADTDQSGVLVLEEQQASEADIAILRSSSNTNAIIENLPKWQRFMRTLNRLIQVAEFCDRVINNPSEIDDILTILKRNSEQFIREFAMKQKERASESELQQMMDEFVERNITSIMTR